MVDRSAGGAFYRGHFVSVWCLLTVGCRYGIGGGRLGAIPALNCFVGRGMLEVLGGEFEPRVFGTA